MINSQEGFKSSQLFSTSPTSREKIKTTTIPSSWPPSPYMLLFCPEEEKNPQKIPPKTAAVFKMQANYCGLIWTVSYSIQGNTHSQLYETNTSKQKSRAQSVILQVFLQPTLTSNTTLPFLPRTSQNWKDQMALEICLKFLLSLSPSTWKLHRTGWCDSIPPFFYQHIHGNHLWVTTPSFKKPKLLPKQKKKHGRNYHPGSIHPNHLFPCYLHWNNVISWKNKASINPCGHFVAMKSFFFPICSNSFKAALSS